MGLFGRLYESQLPLERAALRAAAELAAVAQGERLLDVGTGTGGLLRELAGRGIRPAEVVGIDASTSMIEVAAASGLPDRWKLLAGDAQRLPLPDDHFDVVTSCYLLHLLGWTVRRRVLREIVRVLRRNGRLVTVTVDSHRPISRAALERLPRRVGLRPLDPSEELRAAGLDPVQGRFSAAGWPSLCVLAHRHPL